MGARRTEGETLPSASREAGLKGLFRTSGEWCWGRAMLGGAPLFAGLPTRTRQDQLVSRGHLQPLKRGPVLRRDGTALLPRPNRMEAHAQFLVEGLGSGFFDDVGVGSHKNE